VRESSACVRLSEEMCLTQEEIIGLQESLLKVMDALKLSFSSKYGCST
jgi:hypothetical protein